MNVGKTVIIYIDVARRVNSYRSDCNFIIQLYFIVARASFARTKTSIKRVL